MLLETLRGNFNKINQVIANNILRAVEAMVKSSSSNTSTIVRELSKTYGTSFKTNDVWLYRLLEHKNFQIDDNFWRCYIKTIFKILQEQGEIGDKNNKILINIDFTSDRNDFLILCASVTLGDSAVPLYFSMRNYPKHKNQYNHKKMEIAFIRALRHILSDKYQYILVADRGFGNERFIQYCTDNGFDIMIRIEPNMSIEVINDKGKSNAATSDKQSNNEATRDKQSNNEDGIMALVLKQDGVYNCHIKSWNRDFIIIRHSKEEKTWYLLTNMNIQKSKEAAKIYADRFKIEKLFQNLKSSGFDIEKSKIKKYDRFKRILFLSCFAHSITVLIGKFINEKLPAIKKNSPVCLNLLIASSNLAYLPSLTTQKNLIKS